MNTHSKRVLIIVCVVVGLGVLGAVSNYLGRVLGTIPNGQTRFVAIDKFEEIRDCGGLLTSDGKNCYRYDEAATPEACGTEPTVESVTYGTGFYGLIVPTRPVAPQEKLTETLTKDGQVVAFKKLEGADIYSSKSETCWVDNGLFSTTETGAADDEFQKWPGGPLPVGRYHFELTSGTEVLSAGDLTITA